jgi:hypothetical protein
MEGGREFHVQKIREKSGEKIREKSGEKIGGKRGKRRSSDGIRRYSTLINAALTLLSVLRRYSDANECCYDATLSTLTLL